MWEAIQYVGTPLALIAFIIAAFAAILRSRIDNTRKLIEIAPEKERAELVKQTLETYSLTDDNLTRNQKFSLLSKVIDQKDSRFRAVTVSSVLVAIVISLTVVAVTIYSPHQANITGDQTTSTNELLKKGLPENDHVSVNLNVSIARQIRLYPQDKVKIYAPKHSLKKVWFGGYWEKYVPHKEYLVSGYENKPVVPKFEGTGRIKVQVSFTRYRDKKRDMHPPDKPVPKK